MQTNDKPDSFRPDHWADLEKSGLSWETVKQAGICSIPKERIQELLNYTPEYAVSAMKIPYPGIDFFRLKIFYHHEVDSSDSPKYLQRKDSGVHLYVPLGMENKLKDSSVTLYITEGEKKSLKAFQEGLCCVGLGGIWNFKESGQDGLIEEIKRISLLDRVAELVPDSDFPTNTNVLTAVFRLGAELEKLGAKVSVACLPADGAEKIGLDDYLVQHSVEEFKNLRRIPLTHDIFKKNGLRREKKPNLPSNLDDIDSLLKNPSLRPLNPAQDFIEGKLYYGLLVDRHRFIVCSNGKPERWENVKRAFIFENEDFCRSRFSKDGIRRFMDGEKVSPANLFLEINDFLKRFTIFQNQSQPAAISLWLMGTYVYMVFRWYGYLRLNSPTKRSGKTTLMDKVELIAFNATPASVSVSDSWLFREVSGNGSTIQLDELEHLQDRNKEAFSSTMSILNQGFKKGANLGRSEKIGDKFRTVNHSIYSPKVLAGISRLADTISDRCLNVTILKKKGKEKIERFKSVEWEDRIFRLRDDLYIFGLQYAEEISRIYDRPEGLPVPDRLDDRAKDILEPLFSIAILVDSHAKNGDASAFKQIEAFALDQAGIRASEDMDNEVTTQVVAVLSDIPPDEKGAVFIKSSELKDRLRACPELIWVDSKKKAGELMSPLGLKSKAHRIPGEVSPVRGYLISKECLEDLKERYLPKEAAPTDDSSVTNVTESEKTLENRYEFENSPSQIQSVTKPNVTDQKTRAANPNFHRENTGNVTGVTHQNREEAVNGVVLEPPGQQNPITGNTDDFQGAGGGA